MVKFQASKGSVIVWSLLAVVILASFISTLNTNRQLAKQQHQLLTQAAQATIVRNCTTDFLGRAFEVLNERTNTNPALNSADAAKVRAEGKLFGFIVATQHATPPGQQASQQLVDKFNKLTSDYFQSIQTYLTVLGRTNLNQQVNPIPTRAQYEACLDQPAPSQ